MVSVCLPSDALLQHLPSYLGFSYLGRGVSLHSCSSKAQPLLLTLDEGYLLTATLPDLQCGIAPLILALMLSIQLVSNSLWPCRLYPTRLFCLHGIFQARALEWIAISSSRGSFWPRYWTHISLGSCIVRQILYHLSPRICNIHWQLIQVYFQVTPYLFMGSTNTLQ